jgi:hypothetical protein
MEVVQPVPLVEMMVEELKELRNELTNIAEKLQVLSLPEWSNAFKISNELHGLQEVVEAHGFSGQWVSVHARVNGTVVMVMTPDICRVSHNIFVLKTEELMANHRVLSP